MVIEVRDRLALALDVEDLAAAVALADRLHPWFGVVKVGLELFTAAGPAAVEKLTRPDRRVFLDLKLHDIPTTVGKAARQVGRLGVGYVTLHAAGGVDMLRAGVDGLGTGAADAGFDDRPVALGVTVLTSDPDASAFPARLAAAAEGGCGGVVCSVRELPVVKDRSQLLAVVPGIRLPGGATHDQARVGTPADAIAAGADLLVIGRAVTAAPDPEAAAAALSAATIS
ncbi:MAG TPA: orotidine-5'-phosphate decarboxylase [Acidimicrobiia bacterium]|nr:orotidine-5'-phosphate decarboxylase [Acidimicrobiia bacterium]